MVKGRKKKKKKKIKKKKTLTGVHYRVRKCDNYFVIVTGWLEFKKFNLR